MNKMKRNIDIFERFRNVKINQGLCNNQVINEQS